MVGSGPKSGFNNLVLLPTHLIFRLQSGMWHTRTTGPIAGDSFPLSWCLVSQLLILGMMGLPSLFKRLELNTRQFTAWPRSRNDFQNGVSCGCDKASVPAVSLNAHFQLNNSCRRTMDGNTQRLPELMHTSNIERTNTHGEKSTSSWTVQCLTTRASCLHEVKETLRPDTPPPSLSNNTMQHLELANAALTVQSGGRTLWKDTKRLEWRQRRGERDEEPDGAVRRLQPSS